MGADISVESVAGKLNRVGYEAFIQALRQAKSAGNRNIELGHWLLHLLQKDRTDLALTADHFKLDPRQAARRRDGGRQRLPQERNGDAGHLQPGRRRARPRLALCDAAVRRDADPHRPSAGGDAEIARTAARADRHVSQEFAKIPADELAVEPSLDLGRIGRGQSAADGRLRRRRRGRRRATAAPGAKGTTALDRFSQDLTAKAKAGDMDPILGRDDEIRQIIDVLMRRRQNNPILTGEAGVGKTAVVEGFAQRIAAGDVPPPLRGVKLCVLDVGLMQAGASMKGEFEQRLRSVIDEVQSSPTPIILFIDEAHTLIGAGGAAGTGDAANLLKPALARGTLRTIAATTWAEYRQYFEKDPALTRRFQPIQIGEPDVATAAIMLRGLIAPMEKHHKVRISDEAIVAAVNFSHRYIPGAAIARQGGQPARHRLRARRDQPDRQAGGGRGRGGRHRRAREREAGARRASAISARPTRSGSPRSTRALERARTLADAGDEWSAASASSSRKSWSCATSSPGSDQLRRRRRQKPARRPAPGAKPRRARSRDRACATRSANSAAIEPEKRMIYAHVDEQAVAAVVSDWTGIPVGRMVADEVETVLNLADILNRRIVGQSHGLQMIARRIETNRARLDNPNKPIGVFMLCGPSGVGKTETALALAESLYGGEQNIITINMSEFQEAHTVSTLKGAPPGYVGYGEGGRLTEAVRRRPYSVVLLDEIEKAHPDVHELFFQVFDKGVMEDGTGRRIDFRNTLILLTSNVGTDDHHGARPAATRRRTRRRSPPQLKPALLEVFPAGAARAHRDDPLLSAVAGDARRHRAAAARPHRPAHRR